MSSANPPSGTTTSEESQEKISKPLFLGDGDPKGLGRKRRAHSTRILASTSFRLTLAYAAIFVTGTLVLLYAGGFVMMWILGDQLEKSVVDEAMALEGLYRDQGASALEEEIDQRAAQALETGLSYNLTSGALGADDRELLAGDLPFTGFAAGWFDYQPPDEDDDGEMNKALAYQLDDQLWLVVAVDMDPVHDTWELMLGGTGWTLGISLPLALICGAIMSAMVLRRIETINATTLQIRDGGMSSRVPVEGSGDEFDRLSEHINVMLDSIQTLTRNIQQVSIGIAHDLRTPLTRVYNRLEGLKAGPNNLAPEARERLVGTAEGALEEIGSLLETFDALLRIGQIEAGSRRAGFKRFGLSDMLTELAETYEVMASESGKSLTATIAEGCEMRGDRALLVQMVANVVENAIEHTPAKSKIALNLVKAEGKVNLTVWDSGQGIPRDEHENVFKRFYRLDQSRTNRGNGLGLSIVHAIASLHGINIRLCNQPTGFSIEFSLPMIAPS